MKTLLLVALVAAGACGKKANDDGRPKLPQTPSLSAPVVSLSQSFIDAVQDNQPGSVAALVEQGASPDTLLPDGSTPLTYSVMRGHITMTEALLNAGARPDKRDMNGETPLFLALKNRNDELARVLVTHGANINARDSQQRTPLMLAIIFSNSSLANWLMEHGADVSLRDSRGRDALALARENNLTGLVGALRTQVVVTNEEGSGGDSQLWQNALDSADPAVITQALQTTPALARSVVNPGAMTQAISLEESETSLQILRILLDAGVSPNGTPQDARAPLTQVAENGREAHTSLLLERGAQVHQPDDTGKSALVYAIQNRHLKVVRALIAKDAPRRYNVRVNGDEIRFEACALAREAKELAEDREERELSKEILKVLRCGWRGLFSI